MQAWARGAQAGGAANLAAAARDWPVGVLRADADGTIRAANAAATALLARLGPDPAAPNLFAQLRGVAPDLRAALAQARLRGGGLSRRLKTRETAVALTLSAEHGGLTALLVDETDRARAEAEAERQRARFSALADAPPRGAAFTLDARGRVTGWSRSAARFEGLTAPEALGRPLEALFERASFPADVDTLLEAAARAGEASVSGLRCARGAPSVRVTLTLRTVRAGGELDGYVAVLRDDTSGGDREAELRRLAETDPLTGVLNRRAFDIAATEAAQAMAIRGAPFSVVVMDLDDFKSLNDQLGHGAGDAALRALAEAASLRLRDGDVVGRLGGDEFAVALPRADIDHAALVAERLRGEAATLRPAFAGRVARFTASFGVATAERPDEPFHAIMARADMALYRAKASGRDRVERG